jgi:hypothetical protein
MSANPIFSIANSWHVPSSQLQMLEGDRLVTYRCPNSDRLRIDYYLGESFPPDRNDTRMQLAEEWGYTLIGIARIKEMKA